MRRTSAKKAAGRLIDLLASEKLCEARIAALTAERDRIREQGLRLLARFADDPTVLQEALTDMEESDA